MLKINAIKIEITTVDGSYGFEHAFSKGLNIIRGNNSSGKSSLFQAVLYALGLEELLGGKNEKTMQSVLKDTVEYPDEAFHKIIQSQIYLEIENKSVVTIKRAIVSPSEDAKLIDVFYGALLTGTNKHLKRQSMFVHDKGSASNSIYGFHLFLANFLEWELPEVPNSQGQYTHLYLQQIAPSFIVEQKSGWADFFATMPYYGIKQASSRVIEFILNMDIFENQKKKQEIGYQSDMLKEKWKTSFIQLSNIARDTRFILQGVTDHPSIVNIDEICLLKERETDAVTIENEYLYLKHEMLKYDGEVRTVGENIELNEKRLEDLQNKLNLKSLQYDKISSDLLLGEQQINQYETQLLDVISDLNKNKAALKVVKLGGDINSEISKSICPTCHQQIEDTLLPQDVQQVPMRLEDNIKYLESEKKMLEKYIEGQKRIQKENQIRTNQLKDELTELRADIRRIKKDLISDSRMPSIAEIENRLNLQKKVEFLEKKIEEFEIQKLQIQLLSNTYSSILAQKSEIDGTYSKLDNKKIEELKLSFIRLLKEFKYESKPINTISLSLDDYMPLNQIDGEKYNIRFDSSASDFIRCLWAYYISLMLVSINYNGNHPNILMFDEPKQQDMSEEGFRNFLKELSEIPIGQVFVFASFENKDESFISVTNNIEYHLVKIEDKLIKPLF